MSSINAMSVIQKAKEPLEAFCVRTSISILEVIFDGVFVLTPMLLHLEPNLVDGWIYSYLLENVMMQSAWQALKQNERMLLSVHKYTSKQRTIIQMLESWIDSILPTPYNLTSLAQAAIRCKLEDMMIISSVSRLVTFMFPQS